MVGVGRGVKNFNGEGGKGDTGWRGGEVGHFLLGKRDRDGKVVSLSEDGRYGEGILKCSNKGKDMDRIVGGNQDKMQCVKFLSESRSNV